jgi:O-antigen/teichoic acid export membrane protein
LYSFFFISSFLSGIFWLGLYILGQVVFSSLLLGITVSIFQSWFNLNLALYRARLLTLKFGLLSVARSLISFGVGGLLVYLGYGAEGLLLSLCLGNFLPAVTLGQLGVKKILPISFDRELMKTFLRFGVPLTITMAFGFLIYASDRWLIALYLDKSAAGVYSVVFDFTQQTIIMLMTVINLAAYPLVVNKIEQGGIEAAKMQLEANLLLLLLVSLPCTALLITFSNNIASAVFGESYRVSAGLLIPYVSLAAFLFGIKSFYLDQVFHLSKNTALQSWSVVVGATASIGFNIILIPRVGLIGAAYSSVLAYLVSSVCSWVIGRRYFKLPFPKMDTLKVVGATTVMLLFGFGFPLHNYSSFIELALQITVSLIVYSLALLLFNPKQLRGRFLMMVHKVRKLVNV